jgi:hypothetical protein
MIAGGFDDISEEGSYEFANMKATSNAQTEFAMGREPTEMSRPTTTTRSGVSPSTFRANPSNDTFTVHGGARHRSPNCHVCQNCLGAWLSNSRHHCLYINFHVRQFERSPYA